MPDTVTFGSLRYLLQDLPGSTLEKKRAVLVGLRAQMHGLPRPLARRLALATKKLGLATDQSPKGWLDALNRELKQLDKEISALPQFRHLFKE